MIPDPQLEVIMFKAFLRSWKTTTVSIGKLLCAVGCFMVAGGDNDPTTVADIEPVLTALIALWAILDFSGGVAARDADKSSQDSGIR